MPEGVGLVHIDGNSSIILGDGVGRLCGTLDWIEERTETKKLSEQVEFSVTIVVPAPGTDALSTKEIAQIAQERCTGAVSI